MEGVVNKGIIGQGAFGCVYLVENSARERFAIKVMEWLSASPTEKSVVENELRVLKELSHEHVLVYVDHFQDKGLIYIITEYCGGGDLSGFLDVIARPLPEDLLRVWLWQMGCGLEYMHTHESCPVLHRDLKPSNVFLTHNGTVRLGDMGIARALDAPDAMATTFCGTPPYMSPEALYEKPYNAKTDMWSLGCCVVEMATLERAYDGSTLFILRDAVRQLRQPLPYEYSRELDELLAKLLRVKFEIRMSSTELLDDPVLCDCENAAPMELLRKHNFTEALAVHGRGLPSSTTMGPPRTTTTVRADETILTLTESMRNLAVILDEGEAITTFRVKIDNRMRGRRPSEDTVINSPALQTVIYKPGQQAKTKTKKKTLSVPKKADPVAVPHGPDDALSKPVLAALSSTVMSMTMLGKPGSTTQQRDAARSEGHVAASSDALRSAQMGELRNVLTQAVGGRTLREASVVMDSARNRQELMSQLAPLMSEYSSVLTNIVIYLLLMESTAQQSATDA